MLVEEAVRPFDFGPVERQPAAVTLDIGAEALKTEQLGRDIPQDVADHGPCRARCDDERQRQMSARRDDTRQWHDDFGRDRWKHGLEQHQQSNAPIAALLDEFEHKFGHVFRLSSFRSPEPVEGRFGR